MSYRIFVSIIGFAYLPMGYAFPFGGRCIEYKMPGQCKATLVNIPIQTIHLKGDFFTGYLQVHGDLELKAELTHMNGQQIGVSVTSGYGYMCNKNSDGIEFCIGNFECPKSEEEYERFMKEGNPCVID